MHPFAVHKHESSCSVQPLLHARSPMASDSRQQLCCPRRYLVTDESAEGAACGAWAQSAGCCQAPQDPHQPSPAATAPAAATATAACPPCTGRLTSRDVLQRYDALPRRACAALCCSRQAPVTLIAKLKHQGTHQQALNAGGMLPYLQVW